MTEATWFALIAAVVLGGWAWTNVAHTRASLQTANAMKVLQAIVDREDTKVGALVDRLERMRNRGKEEPAPANPARDRGERADPMGGLFRGSGMPSVFVDEQPEPGLEVVES